jgi:hypothetical protein
VRVDHGIEFSLPQRDDLRADPRFFADLPHVFALHGKIGTGVLRVEDRPFCCRGDRWPADRERDKERQEDREDNGDGRMRVEFHAVTSANGS